MPKAKTKAKAPRKAAAKKAAKKAASSASGFTEGQRVKVVASRSWATGHTGTVTGHAEDQVLVKLDHKGAACQFPPEQLARE